MYKKGFTLVELLAVVLIIGILTSVALPQYRRSLERSRATEAFQILTAIYDARERLITEQQAAGQTVDITFPKLDISIKGALSSTENKKVWNTDTFSYTLPAGVNGEVKAKLLKGPYKNTEFSYNGRKVFCCPRSGGNVACDFFNVPRAPACPHY